MTTIDTHDALYLVNMISLRDAGRLQINHYCDECDLEFDSMHDPRLDGHIVIPHFKSGTRDRSGEFTVVIACEGYHIMDATGQIKSDDEGAWEIIDGVATRI